MLQTAKHSKINSHLVRSFLDLLRARREIVEKGKTAIVTNCKAYSSHFKVKSLGQIFFSIFCERASRNYKEKTAIVTNCKAFHVHFKVKSLRPIFFLDLLRARVMKRNERPPLLQTGKHSKVISNTLKRLWLPSLQQNEFRV